MIKINENFRITSDGNSMRLQEYKEIKNSKTNDIRMDWVTFDGYYQDLEGIFRKYLQIVQHRIAQKEIETDLIVAMTEITCTKNEVVRLFKSLKEVK